jgi:DNA-binding transcriptional LysR family regulator
VNLHRAELFCEVVECRSFTEAAQRRILTPASVHIQIRELERELGTKLLARVGGQMVATDAGEEVYRTFRQILDDFSQLQATLRGLRSAQAGRVSAGASSAASYLLIPTLERFRELRPQVKISITIAHSKSIGEAVRRGELNFGIAVPPVSQEGLGVTPLQERNVVLVACPDHPLAVKGWAEPTDIEQVSLVTGSSEQRQHIERALGRIGVFKLRVELEIDTLEGVKQAVRSGAGVAFLPDHTVRTDIATGLLSAIPVRGIKSIESPRLRYILISRPQRRLLPVVSEAIAFVQRELGEQPPSHRES